MINELLINLVNSVLGAGKRTARGNQSYHCVKCHHHKPKLEINFDESSVHYQHFACWSCGFKGRKISKLFKQINASNDKLIALNKLVKNTSINQQFDIKKEENIILPKEFQSLINIKPTNIIGRHALKYLKTRNITKEDIFKYNIGYCESGSYKNMIIIPSYDENGNLNYFTGRSFEENPFIKYKNPEVSRDIIPFELFINWDLPLILCEGAFDAIAIKRNAIPLLGKNIQPNLMKKIVTSTVKKIYIALDNDAKKQAIKFSEYFINEGKEVYFVDIQGKDPSELGFKNFTHLIQKTYPIDEYNLIEKKLQLL
jgi:DNA primase